MLAVPAALLTAGPTIGGAVTTRTLLIAHVVMAVLQAGFLLLSWREMATGALRTWRGIVAAGLVATVAGGVGQTLGIAAGNPGDTATEPAGSGAP